MADKTTHLSPNTLFCLYRYRTLKIPYIVDVSPFIISEAKYMAPYSNPK